MTDDELKALGRWVEDHYTGGMTVDHRPMTNIEMQADLMAWRDEKQRRIAEHGCCGEGRDVAGYCYGYGLCPLVEKALKMVKADGDERDDF